MTDSLQGASGIRVLEISRGLAGANAGFLLAAQGASVVMTPHPSHERDVNAIEALYFDRGKQILDDPSGLSALIAAADVVLSDLPVPALREMGLPLAPEDVTPGKVFVFMTPFGVEGPNSDLLAEDITMWASGGLAYITRKDESNGSIEQERPRLAPGRQPEQLGGIAGATAAILGVMHAAETGEGVLADVSLQEVQAAAMLQQHLPPFTQNAIVLGKPGQRQRIGVLLPAADGDWYVRPSQGLGLMPFAGHAGVLEEPWTKTQEGIAENGLVIGALLGEWALNHPRDWIAEEAQKRRVIVSIPRTPEDLLAWDHLDAREWWDTAEFEGETIKLPVPPVVGRKGMSTPESVSPATVAKEWSE